MIWRVVLDWVLNFRSTRLFPFSGRSTHSQTASGLAPIFIV